jgi:hypothetical protein
MLRGEPETRLNGRMRPSGVKAFREWRGKLPQRAVWLPRGAPRAVRAAAAGRTHETIGRISYMRMHAFSGSLICRNMCLQVKADYLFNRI